MADLSKRDDETQTEFAIRCIKYEAWAEGYATCLGDFDIAARRESRSENPHSNEARYRTEEEER